MTRQRKSRKSAISRKVTRKHANNFASACAVSGWKKVLARACALFVSAEKEMLRRVKGQ